MIKKRPFNSRFNKLVRIDERQLNWLRKTKDCKTMAGFLDKLINRQKMQMKDKKNIGSRAEPKPATANK